MQVQEAEVIIAGAGTSGLAAAACLKTLSIPYIILEKDNCVASLWAKRGYDRLKLHLGNQICHLPCIPFPPTYPIYVPRDLFLHYLNDFVSRFQIQPLYCRTVESAAFDAASDRWFVKARNTSGGHDHEVEEYYSGRFLVVATGETADPCVPVGIDGLEGFAGEVLHSTNTRVGRSLKGREFWLLGPGILAWRFPWIWLNMEQKPLSFSEVRWVHLLTREITYWFGFLFKYLPLRAVEFLYVMLSRLVLGDMTKYGIPRPTEGPFTTKAKHGKFPIIDVGTCKKIRTGEIQVLNAEIESIRGNEVLLKDGKSYQFDSIVFCTGFKRSTPLWLKDDSLLKDDGFAKQGNPNHWKGKNGLYCVGLSRRGFRGANRDAENVAKDIKSLL